MMSVVVRTQGEPRAMVATVRRAIRAGDATIPITDVQTMEQRIAASLGTRRFNTAVLGVLGLLALVVAAVGVFGLTSQSVAAGRREFGIRQALGAAPRNVVRLVVGRAARLAVLGGAIGLGGAWVITRFLRQLLFATQRPIQPPCSFPARCWARSACSRRVSPHERGRGPIRR